LRADSTGASAARPVAARSAPAPSPATRADTAESARIALAPPPRALPPQRPESMRLFPSAPDPGTTPRLDPTAPAKSPAEDALAVRAPSGARAAAGPASRAAASRRDSPGGGTGTDTAVRPVIRVSVRSDTAAPAPAAAGATPAGARGSPLRVALGRALPDTQPAAPAAPGCECRVAGTVEVRSETPLAAALRVEVSLRDVPAVRDTVALFMGTPRTFDLGRVPCGGHRLEVRPLSTRRFAVTSPAASVFACPTGALRQFRVVLEPR